ncbi:hypothetical protein JCGZ_08420 [Jatropha curcas]|uniref:Uncharacterized protein n=1 Tax=Jatropha curcas TaxID=180498 RepID=A0A067KZX3_JATCU|nr:hypothetical protein JCGZ_08420 [Jatropha curcas]
MDPGDLRGWWPEVQWGSGKAAVAPAEATGWRAGAAAVAVAMGDELGETRRLLDRRQRELALHDLAASGAAGSGARRSSEATEVVRLAAWSGSKGWVARSVAVLPEMKTQAQ